MGQFLSIVDGSLNPVQVSDLEQVVLKEFVAKIRGLTLLNLHKRSEHSSITTASGECSDEQGTSAVSTPLSDADDRLSNIASATPPVDPQVLTVKHSAFLAQLLMDEVDLGESTHGGSDDHAVFSMQATDRCTGQVAGAIRDAGANSHDLLEFEFAPNSQELVDPSEFQFTTSNSNILQICWDQPHCENP